jgi:hypothetical protein
MIKRYCVVLALVHLLGACASSSVMDVASDTIVISTAAAPACGQRGAQEVAVKRAAYETLKRGYDKYIILDAEAESNVGVVGYTPLIANTQSYGSINTYGNSGTYSGSSNTYVTGGQPIIAGTHDQKLSVRMFRSGDPDAARAVDARQVLGPDWQKVMTKGPGLTC